MVATVIVGCNVVLGCGPSNSALPAGWLGAAADSGTGSESGSAAESRVIVTLAPGNSPVGIAVDSSSVYWVNQGTAGMDYADGTVMKVPRSGGPATMLAAGQREPSCIAVDTTNIYWTNIGGGVLPGAPGYPSVAEVPLNGGLVQTLDSSPLPPGCIVAAGSAVYWVTDGVYQGAPDGGAPTKIAALPAYGGLLAATRRTFMSLLGGPQGRI